ncbi:MAG: RNA 2',3'-cyclic phosphodiesterase [Chloroflexota bacterium]
MPESLRLFIAIELPAPVMEAIENVQQRLRSMDSDHVIRWSASSGFHITLKFLGNTPIAALPEIQAHLPATLTDIRPFTLTIAGLGAFPTLRDPRIVWAGVGGELQPLYALRDTVEREIAPLGYPTEARPFSPHLTLGRLRKDAARISIAKFGQDLGALGIAEVANWKVATVSLMLSTLKPTGAVYTQVALYKMDSNA